MSRRPRVVFLCLTLTVALVTPLFFRASSPEAAGPPGISATPESGALARSLFLPAHLAPSTAAAASPSASHAPAFYRRTRPLQLDHTIARAAAHDPAAQIGQRWRFELFDDIAWDGLVARAESIGPDRVNLYGQLEGIAGSDFIVTLHGTEAAAMSFTTPGAPGRYQVRTSAPGELLAIELAPELLPPCAHHDTADTAVHDPDLATQARLHAALLTRHAADLSLPGSSYGSFGQQGGSAAGLSFTNVDVMIAYTAAAQAGAGGAAGVVALADHMVARANATFINSRVGLRLRLVRLEAVAYTEPGNITTDLNRLTNTSDGFLDVLHATRTAVGADLVTLLTETTGGSSSGLAWLYAGGGGGAGFGFNVVQRAGCESTYVHEVGHNFGCEHDRENALPTPPLYPYAYGHRFSPEGYGQLRSVMAYAPGDRVPYFSNPEVTYLGAPTGVAIGQPGQAHNAQVLNNTKAAVAAFRATSGNQPPTVALTSPTSSASLVALQDVALAATANDADGTVASVRFYRLAPDSTWNFSSGATISLGTDTTAPYQQTAADAPAGYVTYAAVATDNQGGVSTDTVSVVVSPWYRQEILAMPGGYDSDLDLVGINSSGQIAGTVTSPGSFFRAARWTGTATPVLLAPLPGDVDSTALAIGEDGTVYGESISETFIYRAVRWSPAGVATDLSTAVPGQTMTSAYGQDATGRSLYLGSNSRGYRDSSITPVNLLPSSIASTGIVGGTDYVLASINARRAARWDGGSSSTILFPLENFISSWGLDINRTGAVVGVSSPTANGWINSTSRATYWPAGSTAPITLAPVGSTAESINDHGEIVGYSGSSFPSPFLWRADLGTVELEQVVLPSPAADLRLARAISNRGSIAVEARDGFAYVPVRLVPLGGLSHPHWTSAHFSLTELDAAVLTGDTSDPDGDGLPNLIERAFNLNPRIADPTYSSTGYPSLGFDTGTQKLTLTFHRLRAPRDITYTVEASSSLVGAWSSAGATELSSTAINADWDEVIYQSVASPAPGAPVFLRVRVGR